MKFRRPRNKKCDIIDTLIWKQYFTSEKSNAFAACEQCSLCAMIFFFVLFFILFLFFRGYETFSLLCRTEHKVWTDSEWFQFVMSAVFLPLTIALRVKLNVSLLCHHIDALFPITMVKFATFSQLSFPYFSNIPLCFSNIFSLYFLSFFRLFSFLHNFDWYN